MCMHEQWGLHCTNQWGWLILLGEHVDCVAVAFKMTEQVEQQICIKVCIKLEHSSVETTQMIQKAAAMDNWWLAASSWECTCSCIISCAEFFAKTSNHPGDSAHYSPDLVPCNFCLSPKLNNLWKGRDFRPSMRFRKIWWGSWWQLGELCEIPRCLLWKELRCHCPILYVLKNVSIFHITWLDTFWTDFICPHKHLYTSTQDSFINNNFKFETTQMPIKKWTKLWPGSLIG